MPRAAWSDDVEQRAGCRILRLGLKIMFGRLDASGVVVELALLGVAQHFVGALDLLEMIARSTVVRVKSCG